MAALTSTPSAYSSLHCKSGFVEKLTNVGFGHCDSGLGLT